MSCCELAIITMAYYARLCVRNSVRKVFFFLFFCVGGSGCSLVMQHAQHGCRLSAAFSCSLCAFLLAEYVEYGLYRYSGSVVE